MVRGKYNMLNTTTHTHNHTQVLIPEPYSIINPPHLLLYNSTPCFILLSSLLAFDTYFVSACASAHTEGFERLIPAFWGGGKEW